MESIWQGILDTCFFVGVFCGVGLVMSWGQRMINRGLYSLHGYPGLLLMALPGTVIHELSHAIMCVLFGHKINGISLFSPNLSSGSLGFVNHSYHTNSLYQMMGNFFIGMAPLIGGGLLLSFLCDRWLNFEPGMIVTVVEDGKARWFGAHIGFDPWQLKNNLNDVIKGALMTVKADPLLGGVMLYLMLSISIHIAPSRSDFHNAGRGAFSICLLFCFVSVLMSYLGDNGNVLSIQHLSQEWKHMQIAGSNWVLAYGSIAACFMLLSLLMIMCWALIVLLVRFVIGRRILSA